MTMNGALVVRGAPLAGSRNSLPFGTTFTLFQFWVLIFPLAIRSWLSFPLRSTMLCVSGYL